MPRPILPTKEDFLKDPEYLAKHYEMLINNMYSMFQELLESHERVIKTQDAQIASCHETIGTQKQIIESYEEALRLYAGVVTDKLTKGVEGHE